MFRILLAAGFPLLLAACASDNSGGNYRTTGATPMGPSVITGSGNSGGGQMPSTPPQVAGPAGCATPISEYQEIIDRDVETGSLNPGVYNRVTTDLEGVKRACAAGREAEARSQLASVKARYGYR
jgi:hypothetical protein